MFDALPSTLSQSQLSWPPHVVVIGNAFLNILTTGVETSDALLLVV